MQNLTVSRTELRSILRVLKNECLRAVRKGDIQWRLSNKTTLRPKVDNQNRFVAVERQSRSGRWYKFLSADEVRAILSFPVELTLKNHSHV